MTHYKKAEAMKRDLPQVVTTLRRSFAATKEFKNMGLFIADAGIYRRRAQGQVEKFDIPAGPHVLTVTIGSNRDVMPASVFLHFHDVMERKYPRIKVEMNTTNQTKKDWLRFQP